jgi:hypothetical protein
MPPHITGWRDMGRDMQDDTTEQREVTIAGKFLGLGIVGCTVIYCIFLEKFGTPEAQANMLWYLLGALAAGVIIPLLFCRRPLR